MPTSKSLHRDRPFAVLVTGGAGYIGSHAVLALVDAGWPVVVVDNLVTGFRSAVEQRALFVEGDVGDPVLIAALLRRHRIGAIMHFAGSVVVPESVADPLKYYRNNTANSLRLIESAVAGGVRHFIFSSTAATYGLPETVRVSEAMPTRPINPYGQSKLMIEAMLADVAAAHPMNYCALRYFNVAGADPAGRSGQSTAGATHLIKVAVEAAVGKREGVTVFGTDFATSDGTGVRDYIHVTDLTNAHVDVLDLLIGDPASSHIMNCGYGQGFSVLDVLDAVDRNAGVTLKRIMAPRRPGDPDALVADNGRILERTQWRPRLDDIDTIVRDALAWERRLDAIAYKGAGTAELVGAGRSDLQSQAHYQN